MSEHDDVRPDGRFLRVAERIGDFGNPFYDEERRRDVWNEASAVGFQVVLWLGLGVATVLVWLVGWPAVPYAAGLWFIVGGASLVTVTYAARLGVEVEDQHLARVRMVPYLVLLALLFGGTARAVLTTDPGGAFWSGFRIGLVVALPVFGLAAVVGTIAHILRGRRVLAGGRGRP